MRNIGDAGEPEPTAGTPTPGAQRSALPEEPGGQAKMDESLVVEDPPRGKWAQFAAVLKNTRRQTRDSKSDDGVRGLVVLMGATIACLFLFVGLFTTESGGKRGERRTTPSLGRPANQPGTSQSPSRSPVPQLSVNPQSNEQPKEVTESDLLGTMRNRDGIAPRPTALARSIVKPSSDPGDGAANYDDPLLAETYQRRELASAMPRAVEAMPWNEPAAQSQQGQRGKPPVSADARAQAGNPQDPLRRSSIVFVRSSQLSNTPSVIAALGRRASPALAQPGTALVARLQNAVSSAAKVPVVAVIEYNYEDDGRLVVPAGTKAYGELNQATPQGWVTIGFHALEFPGGEIAQINGSALSMERGPLKGDVTGRNTGKRFLTRALTGIGTFAAYAVGGRGLSGTLDNSVLLRERIASNVGLAGEQELQRLAFQQNIVVTLPAKTRFYLVLQEAGINESAGPKYSSPATPAPGSAGLQETGNRGAFSEQELQELRQLLGEMREMNRFMQAGPAPPNPEAQDR